MLSRGIPSTSLIHSEPPSVPAPPLSQINYWLNAVLLLTFPGLHIKFIFYFSLCSFSPRRRAGRGSADLEVKSLMNRDFRSEGCRAFSTCELSIFWVGPCILHAEDFSWGLVDGRRTKPRISIAVSQDCRSFDTGAWWVIKRRLSWLKAHFYSKKANPIAVSWNFRSMFLF